MEAKQYLSEIFGPQALQINLANSPEGLIGRFEWSNAPEPLRMNIDSPFTILPKDCSGHFNEYQTLPAYKMLELLAGITGFDSFNMINTGIFERIVAPGDKLIVKGETMPIHNRTYFLERLKPDGDSQVVAFADIFPSARGYSAQQLSIMLELAAQTLVATIAQRNKLSEQIVPLITNVKEIMVIAPVFLDQVEIKPFDVTQVGNKLFSGGAHIFNHDGHAAAVITNIDFKFVPQSNLERLYELKKLDSWQF